MTVGELQARMSAREFGQWQAFASFHPFGNFRADIQTANLIRHLYAVMTGKDVDVETFIPDYEARFKEEKNLDTVDPEAFAKRFMEQQRRNG